MRFFCVFNSTIAKYSRKEKHAEFDTTYLFDPARKEKEQQKRRNIVKKDTRFIIFC